MVTVVRGLRFQKEETCLCLEPHETHVSNEKGPGSIGWLYRGLYCPVMRDDSKPWQGSLLKNQYNGKYKLFSHVYPACHLANKFQIFALIRFANLWFQRVCHMCRMFQAFYKRTEQITKQLQLHTYPGNLQRPFPPVCHPLNGGLVTKGIFPEWWPKQIRLRIYFINCPDISLRPRPKNSWKPCRSQFVNWS